MDKPDDIPEAFPGLQYSKGFVRCTKCLLVRPTKLTVVADGKRICKDPLECSRMKTLKEEDDRGEAQVVKQQQERARPEDVEKRAPQFWNSSPFLL